MFVNVFSRMIEKKTESVLLMVRRILTEEQQILYKPGKHSVLVSTTKNQDTSSRWDMPEPDAQAIELIHSYEESTNTKRLQ